jgi:sugar lactone lactonase YvrE
VPLRRLDPAWYSRSYGQRQGSGWLAGATVVWSTATVGEVVAGGRDVGREWRPEDLIAGWTLVEADQRLVGNKTGVTRLGFALVLKFFEIEGRFPENADDGPRRVIL